MPPPDLKNGRSNVNKIKNYPRLDSTCAARAAHTAAIRRAVSATAACGPDWPPKVCVEQAHLERLSHMHIDIIICSSSDKKSDVGRLLHHITYP